jgi:O-antigen ligase
MERAAFVFMILMFVCAPHSIAATQIAWLTGMFIWAVRMFFKPRPPLVRTPLDVALWVFFAWSIITSIFSYDPLTSLDKLRNVALFLIFYYVVNVVKTKRAVVFLAFAIITSTMVSVGWTPIERIFGRGVEIVGVSKESPLSKAILLDGDTLLKANDVKIKTPDDVFTEMQRAETTELFVYRPDFYFKVTVKRADLLGGESALEQIGVADWKRSRNWRSAGFYGHYTTFAEVLQLIASLTFGLFVASLSRRFSRRNNKEATEKGRATNGGRQSLILAACLAAMSFALLLTVTRASQLAFLISAAAMVILIGNRKMILTAAAIILPIALIGLVFLQQSRQVGFFDPNDASTRDRQTFYRKGFDLWTSSARNFTLGVGMDSTKRYVKEWNLYDNGGMPMGHFHSTPLQLLVERGLLGLLLWLWVLWIYGRTLFKVISQKAKIKNQDLRFRASDSALNWREMGIVLGSFGGLVGFTASGMVHFNLGDAEVAMVFFMLMGLSICICNFGFQTVNRETELPNNL